MYFRENMSQPGSNLRPMWLVEEQIPLKCSTFCSQPLGASINDVRLGEREEGGGGVEKRQQKELHFEGNKKKF